MVFSALKGVLLLVFIGFLGLATMYLDGLPGGVNLIFGSDEFHFSFLTAISLFVICFLLMILILKVASFIFSIISFLRGDETAIKRFFDRSRERKGLKAFSNSIIALEEGENEKAFSEAKKAEKFLKLPHMTALLGAQVARANGFISSEREYNKRLLKYPETRLVGLKGIINSTIEDGDIDTALVLAEKVKEIGSKNAKFSETIFYLQCKTGDWLGAHQSISELYKKKSSISGDQLRRKEAVVLTAAAKQSQLSGHTEKALSYARKAIKKTSGFIPALVVCAELEHLIGKKAVAVKIIKQNWALEPHPLLASVYANFFPDETPDSRLDRFQSLLRNINHLEAAIVSANLNISTENFPKARSLLVPFTETELDSRVATLMAAAEKGCGEDERVVSGWLAKSATSKRPPDWICSKCGHIDFWQPVCSKCESFDSQIWGSPSSSTELHNGLAKLPFILDNSENKSLQLNDDISGTEKSEKMQDTIKTDNENRIIQKPVEDENVKAGNRSKERETSRIVDNARKIN